MIAIIMVKTTIQLESKSILMLQVKKLYNMDKTEIEFHFKIDATDRRLTLV
jgi:hypothetical protein